MITLDEILLLIFSFCDRSCLYPLILSTKHLGIIAKLVIPSPNVIVEVFVYFDYNSSSSYYLNEKNEYKYVSWRDYVLHKRGLLKSTTFTKKIKIMKTIKYDKDNLEYLDLKRYDGIIDSYPNCIYTLDENEPLFNKYTLIIENIMSYKVYFSYGPMKQTSTFIDENINSIPRDIFDYLDKDCPDVIKYLMKNYNFKFTKESIIIAFMNKCYENLYKYVRIDFYRFYKLLNRIRGVLKKEIFNLDFIKDKYYYLESNEKIRLGIRRREILNEDMSLKEHLKDFL
jgi:hypothetical protein